jgi:hypothetical protein
MAAATTGSPKTSPQRPKGLLEVTITEARSQRHRHLDRSTSILVGRPTDSSMPAHSDQRERENVPGQGETASRRARSVARLAEVQVNGMVVRLQRSTSDDDRGARLSLPSSQ